MRDKFNLQVKRKACVMTVKSLNPQKSTTLTEIDEVEAEVVRGIQREVDIRAVHRKDIGIDLTVLDLNVVSVDFCGYFVQLNIFSWTIK